MSHDVSALERARIEYEPGVPELLRRGISAMGIEEGPPTTAAASPDVIRERFPRTYGAPVLSLGDGGGPERARALTVGVVLSGGQAPGGHNVVSGLLDAVRSAHPDSRLLGFRGGPRGILEQDYDELTPERVAPYRNTGGFDIIGSGRDKLETPEQLQTCAEVCRRLELDGLVVVGGDDSNTNAAVLAEHFAEQGVGTTVVGVPKTIDGDLRGEHVEISFGFHTATRVYSELIGNICRDARSAKKYWHFIRLMGRSASHVTLECALTTQANVALIAEEIRERGQTLDQVVETLAEAIALRAADGKNYGVCLVPEGLIEFIPEVGVLIAELNDVLHEQAESFERLSSFENQRAFAAERLTPGSRRVLEAMPARIQEQLLLDRDSHGNVRVSQIDTEQLLIAKVDETLASWKETGRYSGVFGYQPHFLGYEGRCAAPSNFDAGYTYSLGRLAAALVAFERTGYLCSIRRLARGHGEWQACGVPLTSMMQVETRKGRPTPVIAKALVETDGVVFRHFVARRERWQREDAYIYPGPLQYFGPEELTDEPPQILRIEQGH